MHAGAEGTAALHLTGQDEIYGGENRGNQQASQTGRHRVDHERRENRIGYGELTRLVERVQPDADHQEQRELQKHSHTATDQSLA